MFKHMEVIPTVSVSVINPEALSFSRSVASEPDEHLPPATHHVVDVLAVAVLSNELVCCCKRSDRCIHTDSHVIPTVYQLLRFV